MASDRDIILDMNLHIELQRETCDVKLIIVGTSGTRFRAEGVTQFALPPNVAKSSAPRLHLILQSATNKNSNCSHFWYRYTSSLLLETSESIVIIL